VYVFIFRPVTSLGSGNVALSCVGHFWLCHEVLTVTNFVDDYKAVKYSELLSYFYSSG
jgi:hypothetical protein